MSHDINIDDFYLLNLFSHDNKRVLGGYLLGMIRKQNDSRHLEKQNMPTPIELKVFNNNCKLCDQTHNWRPYSWNCVG
jgi:hypothetical protein